LVGIGEPGIGKSFIREFLDVVAPARGPGDVHADRRGEAIG
jgi:hypothetical protein